MISKHSLDWADPTLLYRQLTDDRRAVRDAAKTYSTTFATAQSCGRSPHLQRIAHFGSASAAIALHTRLTLSLLAPYRASHQVPAKDALARRAFDRATTS